MSLYRHTEQLAKRLQKSWEHSEYIFYRDLAQSTDNEHTRDNCQQILRYMAEGVWSYGHNYRVKERQSNFEIVYDDKVSGMPKVHCVVGKRHGDVARWTTELINESCFQYNLLDPRSREACLAAAEHTGDYLG